MTADLSDLVVEILHNRGDDKHPDWSVGSGFFVGPSLVLTALHNVDGQGELLVRIHGKEEHPATVSLPADKDHKDMDLAVLKVPDVVVDVPRLQYGTVDRSAPAVVERCWAIGFPRLKVLEHEPDKPKPPPSCAHVNGEIPTGEYLGQQLLTLQVRTSPRPQPQGSEWEGMSGAVVFWDGYIVVGVITEHHPLEGESALTVVPITAIDLLPEAEATKWWKLLGVDHQALVHLPDEALSSLSRPGSIDTQKQSTPPFDEALLGSEGPFVDREKDLEGVMKRLQKGSVVGITALRGLGGIGKTRLAGEAVRRLRREGRFRDGIAVVLCQDQTDAITIVQRVLTRFNPERRQPQTNVLSELIDVAHHLLDGKEALVVLDNIEPGIKNIRDAVIPFRATSTSLLITARQMLPTNVVPETQNMEVELLSEDNAIDLFAQFYGRQSGDDLNSIEKDAVTRIVVALDRHTLAVELAGAYARVRDLETLAQELEDPQWAIEILPGEDTSQAVAKIFARSFDALPPSSDEQLLFVALGAFSSVEFSRLAVLELGNDLGLANSAASIDLLLQRSIVKLEPSNNAMPAQSDRERLRIHQLVRAFALNKFERDRDWPQGKVRRDDAHHALTRYYATYSARLSEEGFDRALGADEENIHKQLKWALEHGENELVVQLCKGMQIFWRNGGRRDASDTYLPKGIEAAEMVHDRLAKAELAYTHGQTLFQTGRPDEAASFYQMSLDIHREMKNKMQEGIILAAFGRLNLSIGHIEEAKRYCLQALEIHRKIKEQKETEEKERKKAQQEEGVDLSSLAQITIDCGQLEKAERYLDQAQQVAPSRQQGRARRIDCIEYGRIAVARKKLKEAKKYFEDALDISQNKTGEEREMDRRGEAASLSWLGQVALDRSQLEEDKEELLEEAKKRLNDALKIHQIVQDKEGVGVVLFRLARLAEAQDELESAEKQYQASLDIFRTAQVGRLIPSTLLEFGHFLIERRGKREEGCSMLLQAVQLYAKMGIHTAEAELPSEQKVREVARRLGCSEQ